MEEKLCANIECEPPFGGKWSCEFNENGICRAPAATIPAEDFREKASRLVGKAKSAAGEDI